MSAPFAASAAAGTRQPDAHAVADAPWAGFWMGGYEGADHVNAAGTPLDMAAASGHLDRLDEDYANAARAGIRCVRESIGWRLSEAPGGTIDLARAEHMARRAEAHGLQILWTVMHYGLPGDLSLHDDALIGRLASFSAEVARVIGRASRLPPVFTPVNEIGFLAWAASLPGVFAPPNSLHGVDPHSSRVSGYGIKRRLARASLAAVVAMRAVEPRARFLHVEPVVHVVPPPGRPDLAGLAHLVRSWQWQAWDLLAGRLEPELGGSMEALDLLGVNHYHSSQWEADTEQRLAWHTRDARRLPLSALLAETWQRYGRPLIVAETSHVGAGRTPWLNEMAAEVHKARAQQVPVGGICLYPLVDRPDWGDPARWHRSGLWHVEDRHLQDSGSDGRLPRSADAHYLAALRAWQQPGAGAGPRGVHGQPVLLVLSHLRWDFVRHRTQHLLVRLAAHWRVVFVEEPVAAADGPGRLDCICHGPGLDVLVPHLPELRATAAENDGEPAAQGSYAATLRAAAAQALQQALLQAWWLQRGLPPPVAWLTTPIALPLARAMHPLRLVYDCGDELAAFDNAPPTLPALEAQLLAAADLVLAAGPALAAARETQAGQRLHLLRNGVDASLFGSPASGWDQHEADMLQARLPGPRLGYAGVVDERMDLGLLAHLADARPQWQFVLVGPVCKIDPALLPQRPNIHWLGEQPYRVLPALMAGWQVALLPFLLRAATERANPLKLLEYLAAGLPVVASPLPEVTALPHGLVQTAPAPAPFLDACERMLGETAPLRTQRRAAARAWVQQHDWDDVAVHAQRLLLRVVAGPPESPHAGAAFRTARVPVVSG